MLLKELIEILEDEDPKKILKLGFSSPHSYRGYYEELAFEPEENISVGEMLEIAKKCIGEKFYGYKGGEFIMDEYSDVWLAEWGYTGETLGPILLRFMLNNYVKAEEDRCKKCRFLEFYRLVSWAMMESNALTDEDFRDILSWDKDE